MANSHSAAIKEDLGDGKPATLEVNCGVSDEDSTNSDSTYVYFISDEIIQRVVEDRQVTPYNPIRSLYLDPERSKIYLISSRVLGSRVRDPAILETVYGISN